MRLLGTSLILALVFVSGCASVLAPALKPSVEQDAAALRGGQYALDPAHAALLFRIDHLGFSKFVGRFEVFDASLDFDEAGPADARIEALIDMTSLDIANDEFAETLMGPGWFDTGAFPNARFESTAIAVTGDTTGAMTGNLTMNGVTEQITLDVTFNGGGRDRLRGAYVVGFSAEGRISRAAFGVDRFSGVIADEVEIEIEAEFLRR
ncbi:MAG: YceI family protein [Pseudomonadota bacterium]